MVSKAFRRGAVAAVAALALAGCAGGARDDGPRERGGFFRSIFGGGNEPAAPVGAPEPSNRTATGERPSSVFDMFAANVDPGVQLRVNRYIWNAALDVLNFLPVESVDPFSGVIVMGYGVPPGGGRAYRATVYVQDPSLDARALRVALESRGGGAVSLETTRAIEDAILTRARQLRVAEGRL